MAGFCAGGLDRFICEQRDGRLKLGGTRGPAALLEAGTEFIISLLESDAGPLVPPSFRRRRAATNKTIKTTAQSQP